MDFASTDEHEALRTAVRGVCQKLGPGYFAERARAGEPATELWSALADHGFIGINLPEEYGGGGAGMVELAIVCEAAASAGAPVIPMLVSSAIAGEVLTRFGSTQQKERWLPPLASGEIKIAFGATEPDAGSNTHRISTKAVRDGDDWLITGQKYYITAIDEAAAILTLTRTGTDEQGRPQLSLFLVPTDSPGLEMHHLPVGIQLPERQFTVHFDQVRVPADALVGSEGEGLRIVFHGLNPERIGAAALAVGVGRHVLDRAAEHARIRQVWDVPIGAHQGVSHPLARAKVEVELAALMLAKAAWLHDEHQPAGEAANMAKYAGAEAAMAAVEAAIQTHGGNGLSDEYGFIPLWGVARLLQIAPVSRDMVLNFVAQHSLGLPRSY